MSPENCTEALSCRSPVLGNWVTVLILTNPTNEVLQLISCWQNRGETNNPSVTRIRAAKESLDQNFVTNFTLSRANRMSLIEHNQADVIEYRRVVSQSKVQFLRCRDDDIAILQ